MNVGRSWYPLAMMWQESLADAEGVVKFNGDCSMNKENFHSSLETVPASVVCTFVLAPETEFFTPILWNYILYLFHLYLPHESSLKISRPTFARMEPSSRLYDSS